MSLIASLGGGFLGDRDVIPASCSDVAAAWSTWFNRASARPAKSASQDIKLKPRVLVLLSSR